MPVSKSTQWSQNEIIRWTLLEFKIDKAQFTSNTIVTADGSLQSNSETFIAKM